MMSIGRRVYALKMWWATTMYWIGKMTGVLVIETAIVASTTANRYEFTDTAVSGRWWRTVKTRAWNAVGLAAVAYRICTETWPMTRAAHLQQASCYDIVCAGPWCVYACVYYAVAWVDRTLEVIALIVAVTWRRRSTVDCLNRAAGLGLEDEDDDYGDNGVSWNAYLTIVFPVVQFITVAANAISSRRYGAWQTAAATVAAVASCAPVAAHGIAATLLVVANSSMRSINHRITRMLLSRRRAAGHGTPPRRQRSVHPRADVDGDDGQWWRRQQRMDTVARLANKHWRTTELVTDGVCNAYGVDLMAAVLSAAVRVTYVAISVFYRLTDNVGQNENAWTSWSLVFVMLQLIAWFGQFAYLAYTCDELTTQSGEMFDNLNSLLLDIFKESRLSGETCPSRIQEIELVQEFMRQIVARKVIVHACGGLLTLNLSLITTIIGVTLTYFIVLLQFESTGDVHNSTITQ